VFIHSYEDVGRSIFTEIHAKQLYGNNRVYFVPGWWKSDWYDAGIDAGPTEKQVRMDKERSGSEPP